MKPISDKIPIFKRKIASFLSKEDGKISKENLIKAGIFVAAISLMADSSEALHTNHNSDYTNDCTWSPAAENTAAVMHKNSASIAPSGTSITATHQHCAGENSHASHTSTTGHVSGNAPCYW